MGTLKNLMASGLITSLILAIMACVLWNRITQRIPPPNIPLEYWGRGPPKPDNPAILPFKINISDDILKDLQHRIEKAPPFTPPLEGVDFEYGVNTNFLKNIVDFWRYEYNWREREISLNKYPQFKTELAGLNIHFIHVKPSKVPSDIKVLPLVLLHGWPGTCREFHEIISSLTTPRANEKFVFEVVAPSHPGFGFSDAASKQGFEAVQIAVIVKSLMDRLCIRQFYVHGEGWGSFIAAHVTALYPERVLGHHATICSVEDQLAALKFAPVSLVYFAKFAAASIFPRFFLSDLEVSRFRSLPETLRFYIEESGYFHIQATKPDTIGVALTSSPVGLAAYMLQAFSSGGSRNASYLSDGGLNGYNFTKVLDYVTIFWFSRSMTSSMRLYKEIMNNGIAAYSLNRVERSTPIACARFPNEIDFIPESILKGVFENLVHVGDFFRGGHFAVLEEPELLSEDIWESVGKMQGFQRRQH